MMDEAERELFERSLRRATESQSRSSLDQELEALGWPDALEDDPRTAVSVLFELQGAAPAASSALDHVFASPFVGRPVGRLAPPTGRAMGIVLPALGQWSPPGRVDGETLVVRGLGTAALASHERVVVVARPGRDDVAGDVDGEAASEVAVVVPTADLAVRPVQGIDPWLGLVEVTGELAGDVTGDVTGEAVALVGSPDTSATPWIEAVALAQLAIGHELVGAARRMLGLGCEHAIERVQFGQPIARFQAVRHRLADTLVAIETADAVLAAAWDDRSPPTAAMAKALAGRAARTAARHSQQVLAGIGFTTEHPLHRYVRRILALDQLFGAARTLTRQLGTELLQSRQLPPMLPL